MYTFVFNSPVPFPMSEYGGMAVVVAVDVDDVIQVMQNEADNNESDFKYTCSEWLENMDRLRERINDGKKIPALATQSYFVECFNT